MQLTKPSEAQYYDDHYRTAVRHLDTGYTETSIRHGSLHIVLPNIDVRWNKDFGEFSRPERKV